MSTAQRRPELMSLLPTFTRDGAEYWDKDAVPVDLPPLHGFHGFFRSEVCLYWCVDGLEKKFKERCREIEQKVMEGVEKQENLTFRDHQARRMLTSLAFRRYSLPQELLNSVNAYSDPLPMPPPLTEPSTNAYICEVRVHFLPRRDLPCRDEGYRKEVGYSMFEACVSGLVFPYSDGTMIKTGHLRGTFCPYPIILQQREHIVGVKEALSYYSGPLLGLYFYTVDEFGHHSMYYIDPDAGYMNRSRVPSFPPVGVDLDITAEANHVVKSISWCLETSRIGGHTTSTTPSLDYGEPRIAGFSPFPYNHDTDEEIKSSWTLYHHGEDYLWYNLVPNGFRDRTTLLEVERICLRDDIQKFRTKFNYWISSNFLPKAKHAMRSSNEAHNICTLTKMINISKDKSKKKRYRKELRRQYKALTKRVDLICAQMKEMVNLDTWCARYETCCFTMSRKDKSALSEMNNQLSDVLHKQNLAQERTLLVCSTCPGNQVFDPRHVPLWMRCIHHGCCTEDVPCCRKHVSFCYMCHDPVCHYHLKHSEVHKTECRKTLNR